ncbi:restriction endonuclease subunit S [Hymenobacter arcticus]
MKIENEVVAQDWQTVSLKENVKIVSGFPFASENFNELEGKPLIRIRNLLSGLTDTLFSGIYSDDFLIRKGDILIGMDGDFHIVKWKGRDALLNQRIMKISSVKGARLDLNFAYYLLQPFLLNVHARTSATTVKHLSTKDLNNAYFQVPPLPEQRKIAEILSTLDEKMAVIDEQLAQTQELKKGLMERLLTRGIGHTQFKDSPLGEIPASWEASPLIDMCRRICVGFVGTCEKFYVEKGEGVLMVRTGNLSDGQVVLNNPKYVSTEFHEKNKKSQLQSGDILVARHGSSGQAVIVPQNFPPANCLNIVIVRSGEGLDALFLHHQFNSDLVKSQISKKTAGSTQGVVNTGEIASTLIVIPPLPEQLQIAEILTTVDDKIGVLQAKKAQYQTLKQGLMQQLLTGQRRVRVAAGQVAELV